MRYRAARGLETIVVRGLAKDPQWVPNHENLFVLGPTGVGKSLIACALAKKACRDGYSAFYARAAALFRGLALARADGSFRNLLGRLSRIDVVMSDDWAMAPLSEPERRDSQLPLTRRHEQIGNPTVAHGILDRLVQNAHRIEMKSILGRPFHMIDHKGLHRRLIRFQFQPELLLNIGEDRRQGPIRDAGFRCRIIVGRTFHTVQSQCEIVWPLKSGEIQHRTAQPVRQFRRESPHVHVAECQAFWPGAVRVPRLRSVRLL